jgi:hypothetical protein
MSTVVFWQLLVGCLFVIPQWILGIRKRPNLSFDNWKSLAPIGVFNAAAHGASVLALGAGKSVHSLDSPFPQGLCFRIKRPSAGQN